MNDCNKTMFAPPCITSHPTGILQSWDSDPEFRPNVLPTEPYCFFKISYLPHETHTHLENIMHSNIYVYKNLHAIYAQKQIRTLHTKLSICFCNVSGFYGELGYFCN